jgi:ribosomal protein S18 acetylase RimI-like enzyme
MIEYIVENHDGTFYPKYRINAPKKALPVNLRKAESMDLNALAKILHENLPRDFTTLEDAYNDIRRWLTEMPEYIIVAEHNDLPIDVILLSPETFPVLDKTLAMLCYIAVDRRFRGRGVGEALIKEACNVLRKKEKHRMEVDVSVHNIPARIFHTKAGFYPFWFSKNYMLHDDGIFYRIDF